MRRIVLAGLMAVLVVATAHAESVAAIKISRRDVSGAIFQSEKASKTYRDDYIDTNVATFTSKDSIFQTGTSKVGPMRAYVRGPEGYPDDEFLYLVSGSLTLTASDGSVLTINAGEAATVPKGWTGRMDTPGYIKIYAIRRQASAEPPAKLSRMP